MINKVTDVDKYLCKGGDQKHFWGEWEESEYVAFYGYIQSRTCDDCGIEEKRRVL